MTQNYDETLWCHNNLVSSSTLKNYGRKLWFFTRFMCKLYSVGFKTTEMLNGTQGSILTFKKLHMATETCYI
jgi:hypothetical protein